MAKIIFVVCALISCAAAKPDLFAPLAYSSPLLAAAPAPLAYSAALAYAPLAYQNAYLDAAYASNSVDIRQNYNAAIVPTSFAAVAPAKFVAPATYAAPVAAAVTPLAAPLKYTAAAAPVLL